MAEDGALEAKVTTSVACEQRIVTIHLYMTDLAETELARRFPRSARLARPLGRARSEHEGEDAHQF